MALTPIRVVGSTSPYYVAQADFIGIEDAPTGSTDHRGLNEAADWTVRLYDTVAVEHYPANGTHDTIRVPRAVLGIYYDAAAYVVQEDGSFCQDTSGTITRGATAATVVRLGAGSLQITLAHAMPSSSYRIKDATYGIDNGGFGVNSTRVHVGLASITSTTVFTVTRKEDPDFATMVATDGSITIAVYDG